MWQWRLVQIRSNSVYFWSTFPIFSVFVWFELQIEQFEQILSNADREALVLRAVAWSSGTMGRRWSCEAWRR